MALLVYDKVGWVNGAAPAINAGNLIHMEDGIADVTDATILLETKFPVKDTNLASATQTVRGGAKMWVDGSTLNISTN